MPANTAESSLNVVNSPPKPTYRPITDTPNLSSILSRRMLRRNPTPLRERPHTFKMKPRLLFSPVKEVEEKEPQGPRGVKRRASRSPSLERRRRRSGTATSESSTSDSDDSSEDETSGTDSDDSSDDEMDTSSSSSSSASSSSSSASSSSSTPNSHQGEQSTCPSTNPPTTGSHNIQQQPLADPEDPEELWNLFLRLSGIDPEQQDFNCSD